MKVESLRLCSFSAEEVTQLYLQHTQATGQAIEADALRKAYELTGGQPWLVNGGGMIGREYGVGRGRIDVLIRLPLPSARPFRRSLRQRAGQCGS